ncbi:GspE/PulE family protein [Cellvibrio japonicus]|uniref:MSHA biogenesis protein MshE n=1 Tax=Cellvibrio japonicus (strain Ueda107) TaxID=498211 RepID=B3PKC6_CELJU|nr:GspE/PulE family protein [Cellvibrio japonicus]ACE83327.1 MSHA biogenesis protein MshE [Cellvibrio japonicus Ueda107]QEI12797.1 type II/IV secretion system protein [Cellvibrio japonicus]QEI16371.1 type II/IV secretion system protein [Cellvibrio japonicus]QEI19949.1 type II/IV secretion system protein [Cellvibrio japonicus]
MNTTLQKRIRIGDLLVEKQMISESQLQHALQEQKLTGRKLGATLVELGYVDENALLNLLSAQLNIPFVELKQFRFDRELVQRLPETSARRYRVILLREDFDGLLLGMADPTDIFCLDELQRVLQKNLKPAVVRESELLDVLDIAYTRASEIASLATELDEELQESAVDLADFISDATDSEAPVVKLLQKIFEEAIAAKSSDIHIEPDEKVLRIRNRIDGVLLEQVMNEKRIASALVVRLKLMAGLDISEKRLPQDGRFNLKVKQRNIDVRISTMPVQFGESVVMRLLDHTDGVLALDKVGMPPNLISRFRKVITRPHGLVLVTGPTGSGKTTTLYGALSELNSPEKKIITVEDPVEYRLPRISQVQLHEKIGLTFASVLRATLRQDPDILLVGEIRDAESAEIALRASMTGHMVLSTLHTNDAVSSAMRLMDIGVDGYLVAAALKAIIAQRLVRRICNSCIQPHTPDVQEQALLLAIGKGRDFSEVSFKRGAGCPHCHNTGYRGRLGVFEMLELTQPMAEALRVNDMNAFTQAAYNSPHFTTLSESALDYAAKGVTTLEEVMAISAQIDEL